MSLFSLSHLTTCEMQIQDMMMKKTNEVFLMVVNHLRATVKELRVKRVWIKTVKAVNDCHLILIKMQLVLGWTQTQRSLQKLVSYMLLFHIFQTFMYR